MKINEIIKKYIDDHNLSIREFARRSGISNTYIANIVNDVDKNPSLESLKKIANTMGLSFQQLFDILDEDQMLSFSSKKISLPEAEPTTSIITYSSLSCGSGLFVDDNFVGEVTVPSSMLPKGKKEFFAQYASGDSMIDAGIKDGDLLIFSKGNCESGDIGCFCIDDNIATCKKLKIIGQQIMLLPANDKYDPIIVEPERFKSLGKLVLKLSKL